MSKRILLLSAYDAASHRLWRQRLCKLFPEFHWQQLSLPARNFNWRIRGNSLQWGWGKRPLLEQHWDLLIATSMVDLAALRGFIPTLAQVPTVVYFHENQFVYPAGRQRPDNIEPVLVPVYAALCADRILFNSAYNRRSFLAGADSLLQALPDRLDSSIMEKLETATVVPVPLADEEAGSARPPDTGLLEVTWNHRWEYDKGPELLLAIARQIAREHLSIRLHVLGEQFKQSPAQFHELDSVLGAIAGQQRQARGQFGYLPSRQAYLQQLANSHVVLSTAAHDFQGLSIQEGCAMGCTPLAPAALVYPEYLPANLLYPLKETTAATAQEVCQRLALFQQQLAAGHNLPTADVDSYLAYRLKPVYRQLFEGLFKEQGRQAAGDDD